jgi:hypothetical protein
MTPPLPVRVLGRLSQKQTFVVAALVGHAVISLLAVTALWVVFSFTPVDYSFVSSLLWTYVLSGIWQFGIRRKAFIEFRDDTLRNANWKIVERSGVQDKLGLFGILSATDNFKIRDVWDAQQWMAGFDTGYEMLHALDDLDPRLARVVKTTIPPREDSR